LWSVPPARKRLVENGTRSQFETISLHYTGSNA
jgi:hypothetical protein